MAILGKIRQRSFFLIVIIALALFAFILTDVISTGGFSKTPRDVGSINGTDIPFETFNANAKMMETQGQGMTLIQAVNQRWDIEVNRALLTQEVDKLGIRISEKHLAEALKMNQNIASSPLFTNELGQFDLNKYREYKKSTSNAQEVDALNNLEIESNFSAKYQIYAGLIRGAYFTTLQDAQFKYNLENDKVSFDFVNVPFSSINDSDVTVSDEEIVAYMKKYPRRYKADETRELEFVIIRDEASEDDKNEIRNRLSALLRPRVILNKETSQTDTVPGFAQVKDVVEFVNVNSDFPYDSTYVAKSDLPAEFAEQLYNLSEGEVFGPYQLGDYFALTRSMGRKAGSKAKASHILISYEGTPVQTKELRSKEQAKAKAEEILAKVKADEGQFMILAMMESEDSSNAQRGGDLGFFGPGQMVKPFEDFVFNNPIGRIGLVETEFGFHVIRVDDKQDGVRLATIAQKITASDKTSDAAYNTALKFEVAANDKPFADVANDFKMTIEPVVKAKVLDEAFGSIGNQRPIIRWAYESGTKVNDVQKFEIPKVGHVIVRLKRINEEGLLPMDDARLRVEPILKNQKKAALIAEKMKGTSLDAIAKANSVEVQKAESVSLDSPVISGAGFEPKVVGTAFSTEKGKLSAAIEGNTGVFVISNAEVSKALPTQDYKAQFNTLKTQSSTAVNRVFPALKEKAKIKDNRAKFNY